MADETINFIEVNENWQNLHTNAYLLSLGVAGGDQLVVKCLSGGTVQIHQGSEMPNSSSGYDVITTNEEFLTVEGSNAWVKSGSTPMRILVRYAP